MKNGELRDKVNRRGLIRLVYRRLLYVHTHIRAHTRSLLLPSQLIRVWVSGLRDGRTSERDKNVGWVKTEGPEGKICSTNGRSGPSKVTWPSNKELVRKGVNPEVSLSNLRLLRAVTDVVLCIRRDHQRRGRGYRIWLGLLVCPRDQ